MKIRLDGRLPFVSTTLSYAERQLTLDHVLLDTGSAGTVFAADHVDRLGIEPEGTDKIRRIRGVGGSEFVYSKKLEWLALGNTQIKNFEIQVGAMRYGFRLDGILGMDFLLATRAIIDLGSLNLQSSS